MAIINKESQKSSVSYQHRQTFVSPENNKGHDEQGHAFPKKLSHRRGNRHRAAFLVGTIKTIVILLAFCTILITPQADFEQSILAVKLLDPTVILHVGPFVQQHANLPLLISTDEEGGFVERVQNIYGHRPGALEMYETGNVNNAAKLGHSIAHDLLALGINEDFAPDVDVQLVDGPDQYLRTWGYTAQSVIQWAGVYMRAVQGDGMIACIKHFPGLGDASTDAHYALPVVKRTRAQL